MTSAINPAITPTFIADTHALLWHLINDPKLSQVAKSALATVDQGQAMLVIPAVVLTEVVQVVMKGRIALSEQQLTAHIQAWQAAANIRMTNLTPQLILASRQYPIIPDIFDRLIVAEALALDVPVITKDTSITDSQLARIIW
jgi:PIN domain nuclease of toxin-antitoxin system